jgi:hypothetical protein
MVEVASAVEHLLWQGKEPVIRRRKEWEWDEWGL